MPESKHRRRLGQKAVKNPGRDKLPRPAISRELQTFNLFHQRYRDALKEHLDNDAVAFMVDLLVENAFVFRADEVSLQPINKSRLFEEFTAVPEELTMSTITLSSEEAILPMFAIEKAETSLLLLIEHDMVQVEGDQITIPDRFLSDQGAGL